MSDLYNEDYKYLKKLADTNACIDTKRIEFKKFKSLNLISSITINGIACYRANDNAKRELKMHRNKILAIFLIPIAVAVIAGLIVALLQTLL